MWKCGFGEVEGRGEVEGNDLFPLGIGKVDAFINVLHACVVDQHVNPSEVFHCFLNDLFGIFSLGQVSEDKLCLNVGVLLCKVCLGVLDFLLGGETVEDDVVSTSCEGVSDAEADATEGASDECNLIVLPK